MTPRLVRETLAIVAAALAIGVVAPASTARADDFGASVLDHERQCPTSFRGVGLAVQNVTGGVAFQFTAPKDQLGELRQILRQAAIALEHHSKVAAQQTDVQRMPDEWVLPAMDISVRDVATGVRVTVRAEEPRDLDDVRENARLFRRVWVTHPCVRGARGTLASTTR